VAVKGGGKEFRDLIETEIVGWEGDGNGGGAVAVEPPLRHSGEAALGEEGAPEEAEKGVAERCGPGADRAEEGPTGFECAGDTEFEACIRHSPDEILLRPGPGASAVETRAEIAEERGFFGEGGGFAIALVEFDAAYGIDEAQVAPAHAVGIGDAIAAEAFAEIFGFADVEYFICRAAHHVDAWAFGRALEEVCAEAINERALVGKEEELFHGSASEFLF
jgi:hypothetical protein